MDSTSTRALNMEKIYLEKYLHGMIDSFGDSLKNRRYTDVVLAVGEKSYLAHRIILASHSEYFEEVFAASQESTCSLSGIDCITFEHVLQYMYTGNIDIMECNLEKVLSAATKLRIPLLQQVCAERLAMRLEPESAIRILKLAKSLAYFPLVQKSRAYILGDFENVIKYEAFCDLSDDELESIIDDDELNVSSEDTVLNAIFTWVSKMPVETAEQYLPRLLSAVRFLLLPSDKLRSLLQSASIPSYAVPLISDICQRNAEDGVQVRHRTEEMICVVGTRSRQPNPESTEIKCFSFTVAAQYQLAPLQEEPGACYAICKNDNDVFLSGGYLGQQKIFRYVSQTNEWRPCANLVEGRWGHGMTSVNNKIYVTGGSKKVPEPISAVEMYDVESDMTSSVGFLEIPVSFAAVAALGNNIYIFGGKTGNGDFCQKIQCYNVAENKCKVVGDMPFKKPSVARAIEIDDTVFVFYGHGEVLVFKEGQLPEVFQIENTFDHFGVIAHAGSIIIHGCYGNRYSTIAFDPLTRKTEPYYHTLNVALCNFYCMPIVMRRNILQACK